MVIRNLLAAVVLSAGAAGALAGEIITWDNFPGNSYDTTRYYSSERNTLVGPSWVADDAMIEGVIPAQVLSLEWIGLRQVLAAPKGYDKADFAVFTRQSDGMGGFVFNEITSQMNVEWQLIEDGLATVGAFTAYRGRIDVSAYNVFVNPGEVFFAMRLVGNPANGGTGRNFMVAAQNTNPEGHSEGAFLFNPAAGLSNFKPASFVYGEPVDFAFKVTYVIPEPSSVGLVLMGALGLLVRRLR